MGNKKVVYEVFSVDICDYVTEHGLFSSITKATHKIKKLKDSKSFPKSTVFYFKNITLDSETDE